MFLHPNNRPLFPALNHHCGEVLIATTNKMVNSLKNRIASYLFTKNYSNHKAQITLDTAVPVPTEIINNEFIAKPQLYKMIYRLEPRYRCIMDLVYISGYNYRETASLLHLTEDTVKTRVQAALREMKNMMATVNDSYMSLIVR